MSGNIGLLIVVGITAAAGVYLLLERAITKMLMGLLLVGNAINLLILTVGGPAGRPPLYGRSAANTQHTADPLAQAMILTAIVISMGVAGFILALAYRSFMINTDDDVDDDPEDTKVLQRNIDDHTESPDLDLSDDPVTGLPTPAGDLESDGPDTANDLSEDDYLASRVDHLPHPERNTKTMTRPGTDDAIRQDHEDK